MIYHYHWPNFNLADSMLVLGAGLLILHTFRYGDSRGEPPGIVP
jgi:lipoprotein signal peptidase